MRPIVPRGSRALGFLALPNNVREDVALSHIRFSLSAACALALSAGLAAPAHAQADFYKGKTVTIIVGFTPAGGYDINGRAVARHIGKHIPGNPNVIVQNAPGAGSLSAVRNLDATLARDGTAIVTFNPGLVTQSIVQPETVKVDFRNLAWVGVVAADYRVCYGFGPEGVKTWDEMMSRKAFILGSTGKGAGNYINGAMLRQVFNAPVRQILGFPGSAEQRIAIERGELDGDCGAYASIPIAWVNEKKVHPFVRFSAEAQRGDPGERGLYRHLRQDRRAARDPERGQRRRRDRPAVHHVEAGAGGPARDPARRSWPP